MAISDTFQFRLAYRLLSVVMYTRLQAVQTAGPGVDFDGDHAGQMFINRILPRIQELQSVDVDYLYLLVSPALPTAIYPSWFELAHRGLALGESLPASSNLVLTGYIVLPPKVQRASYRIGGIAEGLQANGVFNDAGRILATNLAGALLQEQTHIARKYRFGLPHDPFAFAPFESIQARGSLSTTRRRKQLPGTAPFF